MLKLLEVIAEKVEIKPTHFINRDPKDNFLLDLIEFSEADYLVTGDKDLIVHHPFKSTSILTPADFEKILIELL
ncbi:MAG: putative toxin-antitoxin system toxin component, PIN family [Sphingobacteriaceae bacterium]|nr:MAG: putative toxin-antitoxin system toxin component, PIN family [Sphingobacteriaceae bacterium]